ncbi:IPT/TIG domain-containing protein, partial [Marisediminicola sp. LYQ85]|uniref:IPT/TIG domain-containing protein n=1 Tax=Marisediminicola sp. LYQ85 TaxID=3391062 RepID=UPI0039838CED
VVVLSPAGSSAPVDFTYFAVTTVDEVEPGSGPEAGGVEVTIVGSCFTGATDVLFGGVSATSFEVLSDTEITAIVPAGTGVVDVTVVGLGECGEGTIEDGFEFEPAASAVSLDPESGPEAGGTIVTITGTDFTGATGVTFDGVAGTEFEVVSDTEIVVTSPAGTAGTVDVVVVSPNGDSDPLDFTYIVVPAVAEIDPDRGPEVGGTEVTITGTDFTGATGVTFDGVEGTDFEVVSDTEITVTTPANPAGTVDVVVLHPDGNSAPVDFTYFAIPVAVEIDPDRGPEVGGTEVTIVGTGFTGATGVTFDGVEGTDFEVVSDTEITVTSPAGTAGTADVVVLSPDVDSAPVDFTYFAVPVIADLDPDRGPEAGGTGVTITGTGFTDATGVTFDGVEGTDFEVVSDTEITVTSPAGTAGTVDVVVLSPDVDSAPVDFTYFALPVIVLIDPDTGPEAGGTEVTIIGTNFTGATGVTFDGVEGTDFEVVSDTEITVTSPAGTGVVEVVVVTPDVSSEPVDFTYFAVPVISELDPDRGPEAGDTIVTITGTGLSAATGVTFGGVEGTDFEVVSDTEITVTSPPGTGVAEVVVITPDVDSAPLDFTYFAVPVIAELDPDRGPEAGDTVVTITGTGFTDATSVTFDGVEGTDFEVVSDTEITVTSPAGTGVAEVVVITPDVDSAPLDFTYFAVPVAVEIDPDSGPEAGGTEVTITGTGFTGATGVTFDGVEGTDFEVVSDTEITVTSPAGTAGIADVVVSTPDADSAPIDFTYVVVPAVADIDPDRGPEVGGTEVTITGTDFTGATGVTFDGVEGTDFEVVSDTEILVTTPANPVGPVDVVVLHPDGDSVPVDFTYFAVPVIVEIDPDSGPEAGGTGVTIVGTGFTGATGVTFDGVEGTDFEVVSDTEIVVTSPAGTAGTVDVVVVTPDADSAPIDFTYVVVPAVADIDPDRGPEVGGTEVTITGTDFTGATGVTFDGVEGTEFEVVSDTEIVVTSPANPVGVVDVVVLSPAGSSAPVDFTYFAVTTVDEVEPGSGPEAGGVEVTIVGSCFTGATDVLFGGVSATSFEVLSDTEITAIVPAGTGVVDVTVVGLGECGEGTIEDGFEFEPAASAVSLDPESGPEAGGTIVTITGTDFTGATGVTFDGVAGTEFEVVSDTEIVVTSPAGTAGTVDVVVVSPNGDSDPLDFTYIETPAPLALSLTPDRGPASGGTTVTITGSGFTGTTDVTIGGVPVLRFTVLSDTVITAVTAPNDPDLHDVVVETAVGPSNPLDFEHFDDGTVDDVPSVTPDAGPETGGTTVIITGTCFTGATDVLFGDTSAASFTVLSDTRIEAVTPAGSGTVDVSVIGAPGCDTVVVADGFTFGAAPTPDGPTPGGQTPGDSAPAGGSGSTPPVLATTGSDGGALGTLALALLLLGFALATVRRRGLREAARG